MGQGPPPNGQEVGLQTQVGACKAGQPGHQAAALAVHQQPFPDFKHRVMRRQAHRGGCVQHRVALAFLEGEGQRKRFQPVAAGKRGVAKALQAFGEADFTKGCTAFKGPVPDGFQAVRQADALQPCAALKSIILDEPQALGQVEGAQAGAARKGPFADLHKAPAFEDRWDVQLLLRAKIGQEDGRLLRDEAQQEGAKNKG